MTAVDLDALDKLRGAATPGRWYSGSGYADAVVFAEDPGGPNPGIAQTYVPADAALIVAATNALPDLIAEARKYRALREAQDGVGLIAAERQRQVEAEGWTPEHDVEHIDDDLAMAAVCYAQPPELRPIVTRGSETVPRGWPWAQHDWKPTPNDRIRELAKAGALIAAEIDRLRAVVATVDPS